MGWDSHMEGFDSQRNVSGGKMQMHLNRLFRRETRPIPLALLVSALDF